MARNASILFNGKRSDFAVTRIDRRKVYGYKKRAGFDAAGCECSPALLTRDGRHILPGGTTAELYLDEQGDVVERNDIVACNADGEPLPELPATTREAQELSGPIPLEAVLDCVIADVYQVDFASLDAGLRNSLERSDIYRFSFRLRGAHHDRPAFLLANETGVFILVGREARFDFIGLEQVSPIVDFDGDNEEESLEFEMF